MHVHRLLIWYSKSSNPMLTYMFTFILFGSAVLSAFVLACHSKVFREGDSILGTYDVLPIGVMRTKLKHEGFSRAFLIVAA